MSESGNSTIGDMDSYPLCEESPYANAQIVSLDVKDSIRFKVHGTILQQSSVLTAYIKMQHLVLPELDKATAHTLIHYLYTGKFQALQTNTQPDKAAIQSYDAGTCVYCAAVRYKLPGLVELAQEEIISLGQKLSIFEILLTAKEHAFPYLPDDEAWYLTYLEDAIDNAMASDPEPFLNPGFIIHVADNTRLLQFVWRTVTSYFARSRAAPVPVDDGTLTPTAKTASDRSVAFDTQEPESVLEPDVVLSEEPESVPEPDVVVSEEPESVLEPDVVVSEEPESVLEPDVVVSEEPESVPEPDVVESEEPESVLEPDVVVSEEPVSAIEERPSTPVDSYAVSSTSPKETMAWPETAQEHSLHLDDIEPTTSDTPQALESFRDELDFESSKMFRQMGGKSDVSCDSGDTTPELIPELKKPGHTRSDSVMQIVMQIEEAAASPGSEAKFDAALVDDSLKQVSGVNGTTDGESNKKKAPPRKPKKKKATHVF